MGGFEWVCDIEWIVDVNISVGVPQQIIKNVFLQRVRRLHDEGIKVQPPEPFDGKVSQLKRKVHME